MATRNLYETVITGTTGDNDVALNSEIDFIDDDETDSCLFTVLRDFECNVGDQLDYYDYNNTKIYSGIIRDITNDNPKEIIVFKFDILLSDRIVNDIFESYQLEDLIEEIVTTYSVLTFSTSFVSGITIDRYASKNKNALEVVKDLISQVPELTYNVDNEKVFSLFVKQSIDSGISLTNGTNCSVNGGWIQDTSNQVTRLTLIGEKQVQESKVELFSGTGSQTDFILAEIPSSIKVEVDSGGGFVEQNIDVDGQRTGDYSVVRETKTVTFLSGSIPPNGTDNVRITYTFEIDITLEYDAPLDVQNTYGIIDKKITKKYINNMDDAFDFCTQYINKYGEPLLNASVQRLNSIDITNLIPGYKIYITDNINQVDNSNVAQFFTIKRVKRLFPEGTLLIEVGESGVGGIDIIKEAKYNIRQLYEQDNNSSIIQKSQIINNPVYIDVEQEVELQLYRDLPDNYMYWGDENDSPVYANIGDGTARPLRNEGDSELFFITSELEWNNTPENETNCLNCWLTLDGDANDSSTYGNNGTWAGSEGYGTGNQFTQAADINNTTTDQINVSGLSSIFTQTGTYSVSVWVYQRTQGTNMNVWNYGGGGSNRHNLNFNGSSIGFQRYDGSSYTGLTVVSVDYTSQWVHVVCINNAGTLTLYINGTSVGSSDNEYAVTSPSNQLHIGYPNSSTNGSQGVDGLIGDVRVFDRVLHSDEVDEIYNGGSGTTTNTIIYQSWKNIT